jgi:hypothetical protein
MADKTAFLIGPKGSNSMYPVRLHDNGDGTYSIDTHSDVSLEVNDLEIGAVELKNATDDTRAKVGAISGLSASDNGIAVAALLIAGTNNLGKVDVPTATPTTYNLTLTNAITEYSQVLPANCRGFEFKFRSAYDVIYAFVTGKVATPTAPYMTCKSGNAYNSFQLFQGATPSTLYFASAQAGVVIEITAWV